MQKQAQEASKTGFARTVSSVPAVYIQETEAVCYKALLHLRKSLKGVRGRQDATGRAKLDYILGVIDNALEQN